MAVIQGGDQFQLVTVDTNESYSNLDRTYMTYDNPSNMTSCKENMDAEMES